MTTEQERLVMKKMGAKGGRNAARRLTPEERLDRALKAARTRWGSKDDGTALVTAPKKTPPKGPKPQKAEAEEPEQ